MPRRLPLLSTSSSAPRDASSDVPWPDLRRRRVEAIGIADTGTGESAARFALALVAACAARRLRTHCALLGFSTPPRLAPELARAFVHAGAELAAHAVDAHAEGEALPDLSPAAGALALLVGAPALASFDPTLAILLGGDRPIAYWPVALRAQRDRCQLVLGAERPAVAIALAALLPWPRVLPGR